MEIFGKIVLLRVASVMERSKDLLQISFANVDLLAPENNTFEG